MNTASRILASKNDGTVFTIAPEASVYEAIVLMDQKGIGALLVTEGEKVAGIVTERDYARKIVLMGRSSKETRVREIMTAKVLCVRPDQSSEECMTIMTQSRVRHLPVLDGDRLVGLLSIGDLVKDIISDQRFTIEQLEHYIHGER